MIPREHPRYESLVRRERIARCAQEGIVAFEGLSAHGRGEAFDYLIGERTTESALRAERIAAALLRRAKRPLISVNGNTAALASEAVGELQRACNAAVEVNLFHRTDLRMEKITSLLTGSGVDVLTGEAERLLPLAHDRAFCLRDGIFSADVILVPLEDGDRCEALRSLGKTVITIDLNPLSRTAQTASLTIVDELTRALPNITRACTELTDEECESLSGAFDNAYFLRAAKEEIIRRLQHAVD